MGAVGMGKWYLNNHNRSLVVFSDKVAQSAVAHIGIHLRKNKDEENSAAEIERCLKKAGNQRFFRLGQNQSGEKLDLEKAIPEWLYSRTAYEKSQVLAEIERLKKDHKKLGTYKEEVAGALANKLKREDFDTNELSVFRMAVEKALEPIE